MKHVISVLVENKSGVLARIAGLFSARGYNIDSLAVGETNDTTISRITLVVKGDDRIIEQVMKQLDKLIDVIRVEDLTLQGYIERDLILARISIDKSKDKALSEVVDEYHMKICHADENSTIIELAGEEKLIESAIKELSRFGIIELVRTGTVALKK